MHIGLIILISFLVAAALALIAYGLYEIYKIFIPKESDPNPQSSSKSVLYVFGGWDKTNPTNAVLDTVEKYDTVSGKWTLVPEGMPTNRKDVAVAVLAVDQKEYIYALGGYDGFDTVGDVVERYDPSESNWTQDVQRMPSNRLAYAVGVLTDSDDQKQYLYAVGGYSVGSRTGVYHTTVDKYDPYLDVWTEEVASPIATGRNYLAIGVLAESDGKQYMYAVGGWDGSAVLSNVEKFDPSSRTWTPVASMLTKRKNFSVGVLTESDGKQYMYAVGGIGGDGGSEILEKVERYDPASNTWTEVASMSKARYDFGVVVLKDPSDGNQYLYALGGSTYNSDQLGSVERYDPSADTWSDSSQEMELLTSKSAFGIAVVHG